MVTIYQVESQDDIEGVRELLFEYLSWATDQAKELYDEVVDVNEMLDYSMSEINLFSPPSGRLLLAREEGVAAGVACMKIIREDTCEIKRMYVRPFYRGKKIGRNLLDQLIQDAKEIGYSKILLDSAQFMMEAHSLYRSVGFKDIELYPETEMSEDFQEHMVYMELEL
jgi:GNAT superfamily N-acetyltransferase